MTQGPCAAESTQSWRCAESSRRRGGAPGRTSLLGVLGLWFVHLAVVCVLPATPRRVRYPFDMDKPRHQGAEFNNSDSIFIQKVIEIGLDFNSIQFNSILTYRARFQFNFNSNCWPNEGSHFRFNSIPSTVSLRKYGEFPL